MSSTGAQQVSICRHLSTRTRSTCQPLTIPMTWYLWLSKSGQSQKPASLSRKQYGLVSPCLYALADARIGSGWSERPGKQPESLYFSRRYSARHLFSCSRTRFRTLNFPENGADCASAPPPALPGAFTGLPGTRPKRAAAAKHGDHLEKKQKRALFQSAAAHPGGSAPRIPTYSTTQEDDSRAFQPGSTAEK